MAHVLFVGLPTFAQDATVTTVDTTSSEWKECLRLLRLDADIADRGTYKVRMVACVNDILHSKEVGDVDRERRLSLRTQRVLNSLAGTTGTIARSVDTKRFVKSDFTVPNGNFSITVFYRSLQTEDQYSTESYSRPSRRSIKANALQQTRASKARQFNEVRERKQSAREACEGIENSFHRQNCVRRILR